MERRAELDRFLAGVERRAFLIARLATRDREDALDLVQDAMTSLVQRYADRPAATWAPLFHRILQNRIRDWARRTALRTRLRAWFGGTRDGAEAEADPLAELPDTAAAGGDALAERSEAMRELDAALRALPLRQREAFLLRAWQGLDVAQTAHAMGCSQGSVKTHYFRAIRALRARLGDWGAGDERA